MVIIVVVCHFCWCVLLGVLHTYCSPHTTCSREHMQTRKYLEQELTARKSMWGFRSKYNGRSLAARLNAASEGQEHIWTFWHMSNIGLSLNRGPGMFGWLSNLQKFFSGHRLSIYFHSVLRLAINLANLPSLTSITAPTSNKTPAPKWSQRLRNFRYWNPWILVRARNPPDSVLPAWFRMEILPPKLSLSYLTGSHAHPCHVKK